MTPADHRDRPSLPHSLQRTPTGPQRTAEPPAAVSGQLEAMAAGFSSEDLLRFARAISEEAVIRTRQDDKLRVDTGVSLIDSKLDGALTRIVEASNDPKVVTKWKALFGLALAAAVGMGTIQATCMNAYKNARVDAIEPAVRAEQKAITAESKVADIAEVLTKRIEVSEGRHDRTEKKISEIEQSLVLANKLLLKIDEKLDTAAEPAKKKPR